VKIEKGECASKGGPEVDRLKKRGMKEAARRGYEAEKGGT